MSDINSMNREIKKNQLRRQIVPSPQQPRDEEPDKNSEEYRRTRAKRIKRRLIILAVVLVLLLISAVGVTQYLKYYQYHSYSVVWELELKEGSFVGYADFGSNVLKYSKDGASYIDSQGKEIWKEGFEMKSPTVSVNGSFAAVADRQGNRIYVFDKAGKQGEITTVLPVLNVAISAYGVTAALMEDAGSNYIYMYKTDGTVLTKMKCILNGETGYPLDVSISPDGTQLIGAYAYLSNGSLNGRVAFHNFSEVGKNEATRMVGGFDKDYFESSIVARVRFLTDTFSCAFADNSVTFFSTKNMLSPEILQQVKVEEEIRSVMYSDQYVGIIVNSADGETPYRMDLYHANGNKIFSKPFKFQYKYADIDGENVILYNEESCEVYNMSGILKFSGTFDFPVSKIRRGRMQDTLIVSGPQNMKEIKLQ